MTFLASFGIGFIKVTFGNTCFLVIVTNTKQCKDKLLHTSSRQCCNSFNELSPVFVMSKLLGIFI